MTWTPNSLSHLSSRLGLLVNLPINFPIAIIASYLFLNTQPQSCNMTTFDVFCTLITIDMREAEREEAKNESDRIANSFNSGDAAKGAKLFQVSKISHYN